MSRLNEAQQRFGFEVVDISVPIGAWQRIKGEGLQLHADVAASGLKNKRLELGVDFLFCITDKPIMYEDEDNIYWNYYCWWSDPGKENIIIFSAVFENLPIEGQKANYIITNAIVQGLTGILAETGTHARKATACPLYWNRERKLTYLVNRQQFDHICSKSLKKKIPKDLLALNALLAAFD